MNPHHTFLLYWAARTLLASVRLGIFDQLARGPQSAETVAAALHLQPAATQRLLEALTAMGWLIEEGPLYRNSPSASLTLVSGSPVFSGGIADHHVEQLWPLWQHLETAVREGRSVVPEAFGRTNPFDMFHQTPEQIRKFLDGMQAGALGYGEMLAESYDFARHHHLADIGGGSGAISGPVVRRYPNLRATIFELPPVAAVVWPLLQRNGLGGRMAVHPGDFFRPETFPPGFDAALLGRVLHNWGDEQALAILENVRANLPPGGVVLVLENMRDPADAAGRAFVALSDLTMLVMTGSGRERTAGEYRRLLIQAGFSRVATRRIAGPLAVTAGERT